MQIADAQREARSVYDGGFYGQLSAGIIWFLSAALATWFTHRSAILMLVVGGFFIFPLTTLLLWLRGRTSSVRPGNAFRFLALQVAFSLPCSMLLLVPVVAYRETLFYPAMMILLGAHYLPFGTLYGMRSFFALAAILVAGGTSLAFYAPGTFGLGGWLTGLLLLIFAVVGRKEAARLA